jgi:bilirubin oxidase
MVITSKFYNQDGTLKSPANEDQNFWGDVIHVNGQPWPFMNVQPRKYRFRFLDASVSRNFALFFAKSTALSTKLPFQVIASDAGLLEHPVQTNNLYLAVAERYEVVFDFSQYAGQSIELRNQDDVGGVGTDDDFENTNKVIKFVVSSTAVSDPSNVPSNLRQVPFPEHGTTINHHFRFHRSNGEWLINNVGFSDVQNRILAKPKRGSVEIWELENGSGGWTHPIHVHLVDFRVLERFGGDRSVQPYEAAGLKDVVWLAKGETVLMEAHYYPWDGESEPVPFQLIGIATNSTRCLHVPLPQPHPRRPRHDGRVQRHPTRKFRLQRDHRLLGPNGPALACSALCCL